MGTHSNNKALLEAVSGGLGSLIALVATYPLKTAYTLKAIRAVKDEARRTGREGGPEEACELSAVASGCPLTTLAAVIRTAARDLRRDAGTIYAGLAPSAVETAASTAVYFYLYSLLKQAALRLQRRRAAGGGKGGGGGGSGEIGIGASLVVAALAGAGNMLVTTPAQVVSTMMMANAKLRQRLEREGAPSGHVRCDTPGVCGEILRRDGVGGFWRGLLPSLILVVNPAIQYALFEAGMQRAAAAKARAAARGARRGPAVPVKAPKLTTFEVFVIGSLAKIGATVVTYPMIVVKSRLQATNEHTADENRYAGTSDAVARIWREEGPGGFFAGLRAKILQTAINAGLMLALKERINASSERMLRALAAPKAPPSGRGGGPGADALAAAAAAAAVRVVTR